jgi:hypothetical protein
MHFACHITFDKYFQPIKETPIMAELKKGNVCIMSLENIFMQDISRQTINWREMCEGPQEHPVVPSDGDGIIIAPKGTSKIIRLGSVNQRSRDELTQHRSVFPRGASEEARGKIKDVWELL